MVTLAQRLEALRTERGLSRPALSAAADLLREQARQLRFNLNVGHTAGAMRWTRSSPPASS